jgi:hypothetical protein
MNQSTHLPFGATVSADTLNASVNFPDGDNDIFLVKSNYKHSASAAAAAARPTGRRRRTQSFLSAFKFIAVARDNFCGTSEKRYKMMTSTKLAVVVLLLSQCAVRCVVSQVDVGTRDCSLCWRQSLPHPCPPGPRPSLPIHSLCSMRCGVGHPDFDYLKEAEGSHATVHQDYRSEPPAGIARMLPAQKYDSSLSTYLSAKSANSTGKSRPIRITAVWDAVEKGDNTFSTGCTPTAFPLQCSVGQATVSTKAMNGGSYQGYNCLTTKAAWETTRMVVTPDRLAVMKKRTADAIEFWAKTLRVTPVENGITITQNSCILPGDVIGKTVEGADLVMVMTARPSPFSAVMGYAQCVQWDQWQRCTVGLFNWVPEYIDVPNTALDGTREVEMHTALHEIVHLLGGIFPGATKAATSFVDSAGQPLQPASMFTVEPDPAYPNSGKFRTLITTPKVKALTQKYFACPAAAGLPLEDLPLGKGAHWEARVMGPELMSYGTNTGQTYISDLTLAFLEDTNMYVVDYSMAGSIVSPSTDDVSIAGTPTQMIDVSDSAAYKPPEVLPPGAIRWGYGEGCKFLNSPPSTGILAPYTCDVAQDYLCTADNKMSAVCSIRTDWSVSTSDLRVLWRLLAVRLGGQQPSRAAALSRGEAGGHEHSALLSLVRDSC